MQDPKPAPRVRLSRAAYSKAAREFIAAHPICECNCGRRSESVHHAVNRSQGGDDIEANLLAMAGDGVRLCHGAFTSRMRTWDNGHYIDPLTVAAGLRETMETIRPEVLAYIMENKGQDFLDSAYPLR